MITLAKYGVQTDFYFPMVKRGAVDLAVSADWTPATGDTKISKDGAATANTTNNPAIASGTSWKLTLTATEMQAAKITVQIVDAATKAVEDQFLVIHTYGNASANHAVDLDDAVRAGLTALPNAAAEAAGGLYTRGTGAGQINQAANGQIDSKWVAGNVTVGTNNDKTGYSLSTTPGVKKNTALSAFCFFMRDSADHLSGKTGLTLTEEVSIDGAAFAALTNNAVEVANGVYKIDLAAADVNGNVIVLKFTGTGADPTIITLVTDR